MKDKKKQYLCTPNYELCTMHYKLLSLLLLLSLPSLAQTPNKQQARTIVEKTTQLFQNPGGCKFHFHTKALGLYSTEGDMIVKGNKSFAQNKGKTIWNDGRTAWIWEHWKNTVTIVNPKDHQDNRIGDQIKLIKESQLQLQQVGNNWQVTIKLPKKKGFFSKAVALINPQNYHPVQLKLRYMQIWITVDFSQFSIGNYPDDTFTFHPKRFPNTKIVDKRNK